MLQNKSELLAHPIMVVRSDLTLIAKLKLLIVVNYEQFSGYLLRVT